MLKLWFTPKFNLLESMTTFAAAWGFMEGHIVRPVILLVVGAMISHYGEKAAAWNAEHGR